MGDRLEFGLLGPLRVERDGTRVPVQPGRQRTLLAALLLKGGRVVQPDELIEILWGSSPPASARASLHNYVKRLRQSLADSAHSRIRTQSRGYVIGVTPDELDVSRFEALGGAARAAARAAAWEQASSQAAAALSLWRGEPLTDVESEVLIWRDVPRLTELRLAALEIRLDADLRLGRHADVTPELGQLVREHPLREQLHALLMLALYRGGRQAEALAAYAAARQVLIAELGAEPGPGLRQLQQAILSADPTLTDLRARTQAPPAAPVPGPPAPRTLPAAVSHFAGREQELAMLTARLGQTEEAAPGAAMITVISGTAGVGKTALAVHWAHRAADRFPDGQLYLNLRGYDPDQPMSPAAALAAFLLVLGLPSREIPAETDQRAARYRSLLAGRRVLVLLDNAGSVDQVRPLLPAHVGCMALVTSRDALAGLVARDGAKRLDLDLLPLDDAAGLLQSLIGGRAATDPAGTRALALRCARLPLALRVAAERAVARQEASVASLVAELADGQHRLDLLDADGDSRTAVRTVFSWSYRYLSPAAARTFRLAALHPGPDFDAYAAAALTGQTLEQVSDLLDQLTRAYLIQRSGVSRHSLHDLLRAYARELGTTQDAGHERQAALTRLFDHYLYAAATAANTLYPADKHRRPAIPAPGTPVPQVAAAAAARTWLDTERASLVAVATHAAEHGWPGHATRLAVTLFRYLDIGGHYTEATALHHQALLAARRMGDRGAEAEALTCLGTVDLHQGRYQIAVSHLEGALALARAAGDGSGQARALHNLGLHGLLQGDYADAEGLLLEAAALFEAAGDQYGHARALGNLGVIALQQGRYEQAAGYQRQILPMFRAAGDRSGEAHILVFLGDLERRQGHYGLAARHLEQGLVISREIGDRPLMAYALADLGDVDLKRGRPGQAIGHHQQSLAIFTETGDLAGKGKAFNGLGEALLEAGRPDQAQLSHDEALQITRETNDQYEQARAYQGLGCASRVLDNPGQARDHWQQALILYTRLGVPEADQVRAQITELSGSQAVTK